MHLVQRDLDLQKNGVLKLELLNAIREADLSGASKKLLERKVATGFIRTVGELRALINKMQDDKKKHSMKRGFGGRF